MDKPRILLVDDHPILRQGVHQLLAREWPSGEFGEAQDAASVIHAIKQAGPWDLVLLDISLPDKSGLECLEDIKKLSPNMPVLMLSMHAEHQFATRALKSGAAGYLPKQNATAEIVNAVKKVLSGGRYLSPACAEQLALTAVLGGDSPTHEQLTQREYQIMRLIASGKTVGEIAALLSRSVKTISSHRVRILEKLKLKTNAELIVYCVRLGLVD